MVGPGSARRAVLRAALGRLLGAPSPLLRLPVVASQSLPMVTARRVRLIKNGRIDIADSVWRFNHL
ncbi:MAG: hypothetical protein AB7S61_01630 [Methanoregulaceae archaeon]